MGFYVQRTLAGEFDERLRRRLDDYQRNMPHHVRAAPAMLQLPYLEATKASGVLASALMLAQPQAQIRYGAWLKNTSSPRMALKP